MKKTKSNSKLDFNTVEKEKPIHVLHADDDSNHLVITKRILEKKGQFQVETALSVKEAFEKMKEKEFDIILSDYDMPHKNGLQFLKELRDNNSNIAFILFTGRGREAVVIDALNLGVDYYLDKSGQQETVYGELKHAIRQVVNQKRLESALEESEKNLRMAQKTAKIGSWHLDIVNNKLTWSDEIYRIFGLEPQQFIATYETFLETIHPDDRKKVEKAYAESLKNKTSYDIVHRIVLPTSEQRFVHERCNTVFDDNGKPLSSTGTVQDITERKKAEELRKIADKKYRDLFESAAEGIVISDSEGKISSANTAYSELLGYTNLKEHIGKPAITFYADPNARIALFKELKKKGFVKDYELDLKKKDGSIAKVSLTALLRRDDKGNILQTEVFIRDITERKKAEDALKDSEEKFQAISINAHYPLILMDTNGDVTFWNPGATKVFGYTKDEIIGKNLHNIIVPKRFHEAHLKGLAKFRETGEGDIIGKTREVTGLKKDGTEIPIELSISALKIKGQLHAVAILRDITEQKKAEQKILSLAKFPSENPNPVLRIKKDGTLLFSNKAAQILFSKQKPQLNKKIAQSIRECFGSGCPKEIELKLEDKIFSFLFAPIIEYGYVNVYGRDITERKKAEQEMSDLSYKLNEIIPGECYVSEAEEKLMKVFAYSLAYGRLGLCITRKNPKTLIEKYSFKPEQIKLLSSKQIKDFESLNNLQDVSLEIAKFLKNAGNIVLLDNFEYLVYRFGFNPAYTMIQEKRFSFLDSEAVLLININFEALTNQQKALLRSEFKTIN